jgi:hypothetical protein
MNRRSRHGVVHRAGMACGSSLPYEDAVVAQKWTDTEDPVTCPICLRGVGDP